MLYVCCAAEAEVNAENLGCADIHLPCYLSCCEVSVSISCSVHSCRCVCLSVCRTGHLFVLLISHSRLHKSCLTSLSTVRLLVLIGTSVRL